MDHAVRQLLSNLHFKENADEQRVNADLPIQWLIISIKVFSTQKCFDASSWHPVQNLDNPVFWLCFVFHLPEFFVIFTYTHIKPQSHMYTLGFSAFIQSKELFMCWKDRVMGGGGQSVHRERIVSSAQSSRLPSSCAWPVSLGSFWPGWVCVCVFGWVFV